MHIQKCIRDVKKCIVCEHYSAVFKLSYFLKRPCICKNKIYGLPNSNKRYWNDWNNLFPKEINFSTITNQNIRNVFHEFQSRSCRTFRQIENLEKMLKKCMLCDRNWEFFLFTKEIKKNLTFVSCFAWISFIITRSCCIFSMRLLAMKTILHFSTN